ncbi:hypothetical protein, partial [Escherichia coli]|uniref:hypothetical protein n=1 Tax=Escherichia coli TaxID=562 RepID=UPI003CC80266
NFLQPFLDYTTGIGLGHNGNIVNFYQLREEVVTKSKAVGGLSLESDSALILRILTEELKNKPIVPDEVF